MNELVSTLYWTTDADFGGFSECTLLDQCTSSTFLRLREKKKTCQRFLMNTDKIKTIIVTNTHKTGLKQKDEKHWSQIIQPDTNTTNMMLFSDGSSVQSCLDVPAEVIVHMEDACQ